jgi:hypothetical protein
MDIRFIVDMHNLTRPLYATDTQQCKHQLAPAFDKSKLRPCLPHGWLMKGKTARLLPLLHTLVEERAGERRFPTHPPPFMSQPCAFPGFAKKGFTVLSVLLQSLLSGVRV